jgi:endonuclease YncB( thermonuclease family)
VVWVVAVLAFRRQKRVFFKRTRVPERVFGAVIVTAALAWIALGYTVAPPSLPSATAAETANMLVTSVYDGDTFRMGAERIRVIGMDAPEIGEGAKCAREQDDAVKARDFLAQEITRSSVRLEREGHDTYGRTLARVFIDGRDISDVMIAQGLARRYSQAEHGRWCQLARR